MIFQFVHFVVVVVVILIFVINLFDLYFYFFLGSCSPGLFHGSRIMRCVAYNNNVLHTTRRRDGGEQKNSMWKMVSC